MSDPDRRRNIQEETMKKIIIARLRKACGFAECRNGWIWDAGAGARPCPVCSIFR